MNKREMTEIFSVMMLAWPNAEMFKGGVQKLGPTVALWTRCSEDIDFQIAKQAVYRLCKVKKFPPAIAEFREEVEKVYEDLHYNTIRVFDNLKMYGELGDGPEVYFHSLPEGDFNKQVIRSMGGPHKLILKRGLISLWNYDGFEEACIAMVRQTGLSCDTVPRISDRKEKSI